MTQHTSRLCKGYLSKKESDEVLHQMTWHPQSPDLNPIEMVWDELDRRVKEKQPRSSQYMWEFLQDCWKSIPHEAG
jgi:transposase